MPLSEDEQRILAQIEQNLYRDDPGLARQVRDSTVYKQAARSRKWALLLTVVGLALIVLALWTKILLLGVAGFFITVFAVLTIVQGISKVGKVAQESIHDKVESWSLRQIFSDRGRRGPSDES